MSVNRVAHDPSARFCAFTGARGHLPFAEAAKGEE